MHYREHYIPAKTTVTAGTKRPNAVLIFRIVSVLKYPLDIKISVNQPEIMQIIDWATKGRDEINPLALMSNLPNSKHFIKYNFFVNPLI